MGKEFSNSAAWKSGEVHENKRLYAKSADLSTELLTASTAVTLGAWNYWLG